MPLYEFCHIRPRVHETAFVHPSATVIGDVVIEEGCYIGPSASIRGDFGPIRIGRGSNVQDNCSLHVTPGLDCILSERSHVGHGATVHGAFLKPNTLIGMHAVIMDGAVVGEDSIIGACSFVKKGMIIQARSLVLGSPARRVRELSDEELEEKRIATERYQKLARDCIATLRLMIPGHEEN